MPGALVGHGTNNEKSTFAQQQTARRIQFRLWQKVDSAVERLATAPCSFVLQGVSSGPALPDESCWSGSPSVDASGNTMRMLNTVALFPQAGWLRLAQALNRYAAGDVREAADGLLETDWKSLKVTTHCTAARAQSS